MHVFDFQYLARRVKHAVVSTENNPWNLNLRAKNVLRLLKIRCLLQTPVKYGEWIFYSFAVLKKGLCKSEWMLHVHVYVKTWHGWENEWFILYHDGKRVRRIGKERGSNTEKEEAKVKIRSREQRRERGRGEKEKNWRENEKRTNKEGSRKKWNGHRERGGMTEGIGRRKLGPQYLIFHLLLYGAKVVVESTKCTILRNSTWTVWKHRLSGESETQNHSLIVTPVWGYWVTREGCMIVKLGE